MKKETIADLAILIVAIVALIVIVDFILDYFDFRVVWFLAGAVTYYCAKRIAEWYYKKNKKETGKNL